MVGSSGYRLFCVSSVKDVEEIFTSKEEDIKIAERLFSSSLVAVVTTKESTKLKVFYCQTRLTSPTLNKPWPKTTGQVCHFRKGTEICNYNYPSDILAVRLNRSRMIISLSTAIYMHNIRDMKMLHSIQHKAASPNGLCALSLNSLLAYPVMGPATVAGGATSNGTAAAAPPIVGEVQIFDCATLTACMRIKAHESPLAALCFSVNGLLLATASEKGTVIRVFCVKNGRRVHEFRRGVKRYVRIASLNFSSCANYLCVSSNTETVHVFRIDQSAVEAAERQHAIVVDSPTAGAAPMVVAANEAEPTTTTTSSSTKAAALASSAADIITAKEDRDAAAAAAAASAAAAATGSASSVWSMGYLTKAVTSYFPTQVSDVLSQDRAFASVQLLQAGLRYECVITKLEKETRLLVACEDGFLYIYGLDETRGGECKQLRVHDVRTPLCGVTGELLGTAPIDNVQFGFTANSIQSHHIHQRHNAHPEYNRAGNRRTAENRWRRSDGAADRCGRFVCAGAARRSRSGSDVR